MKHVHIPTVEELMAREDKAYGVLCGDAYTLKYHDLKEDKTYNLAREFDTITAITTKDDDVVYSCGRKIKKLFSGRKIIKSGLLKEFWEILKESGQPYETFSLEEHNGTLLDTSRRGLESTLEKKVLISESELEVNHLSCIKALASADNELFGLAKASDLNSHFIKIKKAGEQYEISKLIKYNVDYPTKIIIVRYGTLHTKEGDYPFSALCACNDRLYLNENEIYKSCEKINTFELVSLQGSSAVIAFPRKSQIWTTNLNLSNRTIQDPPIIPISGLFDAESLKAVKSIVLHEKLLELGKKNVGKN